MSTLSRVASALSFAHLAGIGSMKGKKTADVDDDDDAKKGDRASGDQDDDKTDKDDGQDKDDKSAKGTKAAGDDNQDDDKDDDTDKDKSKKSGKAKGASAEDDDVDAEDDEDEMHGKSASASARRRERARCAAIFGSRHAAHNPVLAANLAFNTSMTRQQAMDVLRDTPAGGTANGNRSASNPKLGAGGEEAPSRTVAIAGRWDRAMSQVRGK
jgi:hypothetical protein